ncbi:beta-1,6-N-acetylglucosaminyltransferase [Levilactobacillus spicheri]|nr:beta-1,6-N-acetylglucosaminyltransferase [Levilactobacillus spicheri]
MTSMKKHAFLVIANRNFDQLKVLVNLLDDYRNDIYVLIDKKAVGIRPKLKVNFSKIILLNEMPIYWGDYSQIQAELALFKIASKEGYSYYHLLSGLDLPLVSQDELHTFFDANPNKQFVTYSAMKSQQQLRTRLRRHRLTKFYRVSGLGPIAFLIKGYRLLETECLMVVSKFSSKKHLSFGSNWVTLDDKFVQKIVADKNLRRIERTFFRGYLVDEILIPYELEELGFLDTVYYRDPVHDLENEFQGNLRYINWWDGNPYVWRQKDFSKLRMAKKKGYMFARKFDKTIDNNIINSVIKQLINER